MTWSQPPPSGRKFARNPHASATRSLDAADVTVRGGPPRALAFAGDRLYLLQRRTLTAIPTPAAGDHITDDSVRPPNEHGRSNRHGLQALPNLTDDT
jgi:hypothetical protein